MFLLYFQNELVFKIVPCTYSCYIIFFWFSVSYKALLSTGYTIFLCVVNINAVFQFCKRKWESSMKTFLQLILKIDVSSWSTENQEDVSITFIAYAYHDWKLYTKHLGAVIDVSSLPGISHLNRSLLFWINVRRMEAAQSGGGLKLLSICYEPHPELAMHLLDLISLNPHRNQTL